MASARNWFTVIPMNYWEGEAFWDRDGGLLCKGFRNLGLDSRFVALGSPCVRSDRPLILATEDQMRSTDYWSQYDLEGVVLYSWALPRYTPILRAIKSTGAKVILPMDGDGIRSAREWFARVLMANHVYARMDKRLLPLPFAIAKTFASLIKSRQQPALEHMSEVDFMLAQSPLAVQRFTRFLVGMGRPDLVAKMVMMEHPVPDRMVYDPAIQKQPLIVAVGSWQRLVKGAPLLMKSLGAALARVPGYRARVIGGGEILLRRLALDFPELVRSRIEIMGPLANADVTRHCQEAQIILNTSYTEGFTLAVAEALCCGCSAVGSADLSCMNYFSSNDSGTLATRRNVGFFQDALCAEMAAWSAGRRDPAMISEIWMKRLHVTEVARRVLRLFESGHDSLTGRDVNIQD